MERIVIIGGSGQIGRAAAEAFLDAGWSVASVSRRPPKRMPVHERFSFFQADRRDTRALREALEAPVDVLLDCLSFDEIDAAQLLELSDRAGRICVISSMSVYADDRGRTLDEAQSNGFPKFAGPITIDQPTVAPGPETYSTRKVAMERKLLENANRPVSVLRPCAIYGPYSDHAREWFFIKRLLDGRKRIPLAYEASSVFHTTSANNIAAALYASAVGRLPPITNVVDPTPLTVRQIGEAIMKVMGIEAEIVGLPGGAYPPLYGQSPWAVPNPFFGIVSSDYESVGDYEDLVESSVRYLTETIKPEDWRTDLNVLARYPFDLFNYKAEEEVLARSL